MRSPSAGRRERAKAVASIRRRFAGAAAALAAAALLAGCMPSLELPGSGPEAPNVSVTVTQTVNGVPAAGGETVTVETKDGASSAGSRKGQAAPRQAGPSSIGQGGGEQSPGADGIAWPADPARAAAIDQAVQALNALSDVELQEVCAVMCPVPK